MELFSAGFEKGRACSWKKNDEIKFEYLIEDTPGHYADASCVQYGVYEYESGKPLPEEYREMTRYLEGSFCLS